MAGKRRGGQQAEDALHRFRAELGAAMLRAEKHNGRVSRAQLAKRLNVAPGSVYAYLRGTTLPTTEMFDRLLIELQVGAEDAGRLATLRDAVELARLEEAPARLPAGPVVSSDLPRDTALLYGRDAELRDIRTALTNSDESGVRCVVSGLGGVGKTALAVRTAHTLAAEFPDGCVFVNLLGYAAEPVMSPGEAAGKLLRQLGVPVEGVPVDQDRRTALLREQLRDRSVLMLLDNAFDSAQVEPLLPPAGTSAVLVTSRSNLNGLDDARHLRIAPLSARDSEALLAGLIVDLPADRVPDDAVREAITTQCRGLPVAIRIAAAVLRSESWPIPADIGVLDDGERGIETLFEHSVARLVPDLAASFTLLGLHPGATFDLDAAAALTDVDGSEARRRLRRLVEANLLDAPLPGRYGCHDLVRAFARHRATTALTPESVRAAHIRIIDHYLSRLDAADRVLTPSRHRLHMAPEPGGIGYPDYHSAVRDLAAIRDNVAAVAHSAFEHGLDIQCWRIAFALREFAFITNDTGLWIETHELGLAAAERAGDRYAEAVTRNNLGLALLTTGADERAERMYARARELFATLGDAHGEHTTLAHQAWIHYHRGEFEQALAQSTRALAYVSRHGTARNTAILLRDTAQIEVRLGRCADAVRRLLTAGEQFRTLHLHIDEAMTCNVLGAAYERLEMFPEATEAFTRAARVGRDAGSITEQARGRYGLGRIAAAQSDWPAARRHWRRALAGFLRLGDLNAVDEVRVRLNASPR